MIVLIDPEGNYLLGSKPKFYPAGIYRLVGGGVEDDENHTNAAAREFEEELGVQPNIENLQPIVIIYTINNFHDNQYKNTTYLFEYQLNPSEELQAGDDIEELVKHSPNQLKELIAKYNSISAENWYEENGKRIHNWHDYGKMYGFIHQVALDLTSANPA